MQWAAISLAVLSAGLGITATVLAIRIGGLKEQVVGLTNERDTYKTELTEQKDETKRAQLVGNREAHILTAKVSRCREAINALPDSHFSRGMVLDELDVLLQGEDP